MRVSENRCLVSCSDTYGAPWGLVVMRISSCDTRGAHATGGSRAKSFKGVTLALGGPAAPRGRDELRTETP